ncbi:hypothetical protein BN1723_020288, partial [Verticillium longisporum]
QVRRYHDCCGPRQLRPHHRSWADRLPVMRREGRWPLGNPQCHAPGVDGEQAEGHCALQYCW